VTKTVDTTPPPEPDPDVGTTTTEPAEAADSGRLEGASKARIFTVLAVIVLFSEVVPLQYTMIGTAVQKIGGDFPTAGNNIGWMIIILGLVGGATTPIIGKLADLFGKRLILLCCSVSFLAGSVLCALTDSWAMFLVGRGLQAVAFAMAAVAAGLIRDLMPRRMVPMAIGVIATGFGVSALTAPLLSGWLTDHWSWRSLFWFLTIYMLVLIPILWVAVPESKLKTPQKLDWTGSILIGGGVALALIYISNGQTWGWGRFTSWIYLAGGLALLVAFYHWEKRASDPIMDPKLLKAARVSIVLAIGLFSNLIIGVQFYAVSYMAQIDEKVVKEGTIAGFAEQAGIPIDTMRQGLVFEGDIGYALGFSLMALAIHLTTWQSIPGMVTGPAAGQWATKVGLRRPYIACLAVMGLSMALYAMFHGSWQVLLIIGIIYGLAFGVYYACANNLIIEAVPQEQQGIGASMLALTQSFGSAVGTAVLTAILAAHPYRVSTVAQPGAPSQTFDIPQVYTDSGWTIGFWTMAGAGVVCVILAVVMKAGRTPATGGTLH